MIEIREQIDQDEETINHIISAATSELRSVYHPTKTVIQNRTDNQVKLVAIINNNIVGTAGLIICENHIMVQGLAVSPVHRRQGVARAILEYATQRAQKEGKSELTLSTIKETGNTAYFTRMGFTVISEEMSETFENIHGNPVTLVNMSKMA